MIVFCVTVFSLDGCVKVPVGFIVLFHVLVNVSKIEIVVCIGIIVEDCFLVAPHSIIKLT